MSRKVKDVIKGIYYHEDESPSEVYGSDTGYYYEGEVGKEGGNAGIYGPFQTREEAEDHAKEYFTK